MRSLKISNVAQNIDELKKRLRGFNSPGKRQLMADIRDENWPAVFKELLFRIELYASGKVLNYTKRDVNMIVDSIFKLGIDNIVIASVEKYAPSIVDEIQQAQDFAA